MRVRSLRDSLAGDEKSIVGVMLGAVLILLLIVCANLASLMLARGAARRKDIAVRLALGAPRSIIVRHLLAESLCLSAVGGVLGLLAASWTTDSLLRGLDTQVPAWIDASLDGRVVLFTIGISALSALAFGLVPAIQSSRADVHSDIKSGGPSQVGTPKNRLRGSLVMAQLALSLILLAAAGVLTANVQRIARREIGPNDDDVVQARVELLGNRSREQMAAEVSALVQRFGVIPGARAASAYGTGFIAGFGAHDQSISAEGVSQVPSGVSPRFYFAVTPRYFETRKLGLLEGRGFTTADRSGSAPVVIINRNLARTLWPDANAIGRRIRLGSADSLPWRTIIGIVGDITSPALGRVTNYAYVPYAQDPQVAATVLVAPQGVPSTLINPIRDAAREVTPDLPLLDLMTLDALRAKTYWPYRAYALLMMAMGAIALILAAIGLYGIVAYAAQRRTREVGLRIALGAGHADVVQLVTRQGAWVVAAGLAIGIAGALLIVPIMQSAMWGWANTPFNPYVFAGAAGVLLVVSLVASYLPARRAIRIDPMEALREK